MLSQVLSDGTRTASADCADTAALTVGSFGRSDDRSSSSAPIAPIVSGGAVVKRQPAMVVTLLSRCTYFPVIISTVPRYHCQCYKPSSNGPVRVILQQELLTYCNSSRAATSFKNICKKLHGASYSYTRRFREAKNGLFRHKNGPNEGFTQRKRSLKCSPRSEDLRRLPRCARSR